MLCRFRDEIRIIKKNIAPRFTVRAHIKRNSKLYRTGNVLVKNDTAKIADFGIATIIGERSTMYHTPWRWTAPELKEEKAGLEHNEVTSKADVFSFGGLIYECLQYGELPFKRRTILQNVAGRGNLAAEVKI